MYTITVFFTTISFLLLCLGGRCQNSHSLASCSPASFSFPQSFGTQWLSTNAQPAYNFTAVSLTPGTNHVDSYTIDFCNVTVQYTHPGWNDTISVSIWLPLPDSWTGRLQALGGGGYSASFGAIYSTQAVARGDVAVDTDAGHEAGMAGAKSPHSWALTSPGNVNLYLLEDFASRSLHEMAVIGKAVTEDFYGLAPRSSFFSGCSGGGRQGLMLAQRYPEDFDGILAAAPAINIETFIPAAYWAQQVMKNLQTYPRPCEIDAFTQAAIDQCDELDGVKDGIIAAPWLCQFQAFDIVGHNFSCNGTHAVFTEAAAKVVQAAWDGPRSPSGKVGWFGVNKDASLTAFLITTQCASNGSCVGSPSGLSSSWIRYFVAKDPDLDMSDTTDDQFFAYMAQSEREYRSMIGTADPDLTQFRARGGKMITWHGLADQVIPPDGTASYYEEVRKLDPDVNSFYRLFEAPGVGHCFGGPGHAPSAAFQQLVAWVENGTAPDTLLATNSAGDTIELCPYPTVRVRVGKYSTGADSFKCVSRDSAKAWRFQAQSSTDI